MQNVCMYVVAGILVCACVSLSLTLLHALVYKYNSMCMNGTKRRGVSNMVIVLHISFNLFTQSIHTPI